MILVSIGSRYNLLLCNCNHFSTELALRVGVGSVPGWVNRLSRIGSLIAWMLPKSLIESSPVDGGEGASQNALASHATKLPAFSGEGHSLRDPAETAPLLGGSRQEMRERAVQAALARERLLKEQ